MKIGIDVNMATNRKEGYTIIEFKKSELIQNKVLNLDCVIRVFNHYPDYYLMEKYGSEKPFGVPTINIDEFISVKSVWELYQKDKKGIDSVSGLNFNLPKNEWEVLNLCDAVLSYIGLQSYY